MSKSPVPALAILVVARRRLCRRRGDECEHRRRRRRPPTSACCCPDSKSSVRWETQDRPRLAAAFKALGDSYSIVNAEGSASTQLNQAQQCLTNGAKVILLVNLDSGSGAAIEKLASRRRARRSIDYDRLTLKGPRRTTSRSTTSRSASSRARACQLPEGERRVSRSKPVDRRAERRADRQQRDAVRTGLQLRPQARSTRTGTARRARTSRCRSGTTRRR